MQRFETTQRTFEATAQRAIEDLELHTLASKTVGELARFALRQAKRQGNHEASLPRVNDLLARFVAELREQANLVEDNMVEKLAETVRDDRAG